MGVSIVLLGGTSPVACLGPVLPKGGGEQGLRGSWWSTFLEARCPDAAGTNFFSIGNLLVEIGRAHV